jgi:hypothetical protein
MRCPAEVGCPSTRRVISTPKRSTGRGGVLMRWAWLIRRFIDRDEEILFIDPADPWPVDAAVPVALAGVRIGARYEVVDPLVADVVRGPASGR